MIDSSLTARRWVMSTTVGAELKLLLEGLRLMLYVCLGSVSVFATDYHHCLITVVYFDLHLLML